MIDLNIFKRNILVILIILISFAQTGSVTMAYEKSVDLQMSENTQQISKLNTNKRIFKPKLCTMMLDIAMDSTWENYYTDTSYTTGLDNIKDYGYDGFIATVEIQPSKAQRDAFIAGTLSESELVYRSFISADKLKWAISEAKTRGLKLLGIEVHCLWARDNWSKLTPATFFNQFDIAMQELTTSGITCEFITLFNECGTDTLLNSNNYSYIQTSLQSIKNKGFKTGLAGDSLITGLVDYIDIISVHMYPPITNKGTGTTIEDGIATWKASRLKENIRSIHFQYPEKEIWITESGVQNYYEALAAPAEYLSTGTKSNDDMVQRIYQEGFMEYFKNETYIKGISIFYLDDNSHYPLLQELYDYYLRNKVNE
jgi:hypothetical protein